MLRQMRQIGGDIARALAVLAVVFLSFAHTTSAAPSTTEVLMAHAAISLCGDVTELAHHPDDGTASHAPCHACRIGNAADLPLPPDLVLACLGGVQVVSYLPVDDATGSSEPLHVAHPRGPPALV